MSAAHSNDINSDNKNDVTKYNLPLECASCNFKTLILEKLQKHYTLHHFTPAKNVLSSSFEAISTPQMSVMTYVCPICESHPITTDARIMREHMELVHSWTFRQPDNLKSNFRRHHHEISKNDHRSRTQSPEKSPDKSTLTATKNHALQSRKEKVSNSPTRFKQSEKRNSNSRSEESKSKEAISSRRKTSGKALNNDLLHSSYAAEAAGVTQAVISDQRPNSRMDTRNEMGYYELRPNFHNSASPTVSPAIVTSSLSTSTITSMTISEMMMQSISSSLKNNNNNTATTISNNNNNARIADQHIRRDIDDADNDINNGGGREKKEKKKDSENVEEKKKNNKINKELQEMETSKTSVEAKSEEEEEQQQRGETNKSKRVIKRKRRRGVISWSSTSKKKKTLAMRNKIAANQNHRSSLNSYEEVEEEASQEAEEEAEEPDSPSFLHPSSYGPASSSVAAAMVGGRRQAAVNAVHTLFPSATNATHVTSSLLTTASSATAVMTSSVRENPVMLERVGRVGGGSGRMGTSMSLFGRRQAASTMRRAATDDAMNDATNELEAEQQQFVAARPTLKKRQRRKKTPPGFVTMDDYVMDEEEEAANGKDKSMEFENDATNGAAEEEAEMHEIPMAIRGKRKRKWGGARRANQTKPKTVADLEAAQMVALIASSNSSSKRVAGSPRKCKRFPSNYNEHTEENDDVIPAVNGTSSSSVINQQKRQLNAAAKTTTTSVLSNERQDQEDQEDHDCVIICEEGIHEALQTQEKTREMNRKLLATKLESFVHFLNSPDLTSLANTPSPSSLAAKTVISSSSAAASSSAIVASSLSSTSISTTKPLVLSPKQENLNTTLLSGLDAFVCAASNILNQRQQQQQQQRQQNQLAVASLPSSTSSSSSSAVVTANVMTQLPLHALPSNDVIASVRINDMNNNSSNPRGGGGGDSLTAHQIKKEPNLHPQQLSLSRLSSPSHISGNAKNNDVIISLNGSQVIASSSSSSVSAISSSILSTIPSFAHSNKATNNTTSLTHSNMTTTSVALPITSSSSIHSISDLPQSSVIVVPSVRITSSSSSAAPTTSSGPSQIIISASQLSSSAKLLLSNQNKLPPQSSSSISSSISH